MKKITVNNYITMYQFETEQPGFTLNITAIFDGDDFVLVDTGYQMHIEKVMKVLDFSRLKAVIFTHHHPDHTFGAKLLKNVPLIGHKEYQIGFDEAVAIFNYTHWLIDDTVPTKFMEDKETYTFGRHTFTFHHNPLHTLSSMLIDLNKEYLFTGDEILSTTDGENIPSIFFSKRPLVDNAFDSLLDLSRDRIIIPGHGNVIYNNIKDIIQQRNLYVSLVKQGIQFYDLGLHGYQCTCFEQFHKMNLTLHSEKVGKDS